jgi:hypothetical protein
VDLDTFVWFNTLWTVLTKEGQYIRIQKVLLLGWGHWCGLFLKKTPICGLSKALNRLQVVWNRWLVLNSRELHVIICHQNYPFFTFTLGLEFCRVLVIKHWCLTQISRRVTKLKALRVYSRYFIELWMSILSRYWGVIHSPLLYHLRFSSSLTLLYKTAICLSSLQRTPITNRPL